MIEDSVNVRFEIIDQLSDIRRRNFIGLPIGLLMHAVLNTIDLFELVKFYVTNEPGHTVIGRNIFRRMPEYKGNIGVYDFLFEQLKVAQYVNRLRFRKLMDTIISSLDETRQQEYFTYFSNSRYRIEIRSAIKMTSMIWNSELGNRFLENYHQTRNPDLLDVLITNLEINRFKELAIAVWTPNLANYWKPKLINRIKGWPLSDIDFVKNADPANYLVLARYSNEAIDDETLLDCYTRTPESYRPFALWNLGRMGKWHLIKEPIEQFIEHPNSTFEGFSDTIFD